MSDITQATSWIDDLLPTNIKYTFTTTLEGSQNLVEGFQSDFFSIGSRREQDLFVIPFYTHKQQDNKEWHINIEIESETHFPDGDEPEVRTASKTLNNRDCALLINIWNYGDILMRMHNPESIMLINLNIKIVDYHGLPIAKHLVDFTRKLINKPDFRLEVDGGAIDVNKYILSSKSMFFKEMFSNTAESNKTSMVIPDVKYHEFIKFIGLLYGIKPNLGTTSLDNNGKINIRRDKKVDYLMKFSDRFDAPSIKSVLTNMLKQYTFSEVSPFLLIAEKYNQPLILKKVVESVSCGSQLQTLTAMDEFKELSDYTKNCFVKNVIARVPGWK